VTTVLILPNPLRLQVLQDVHDDAISALVALPGASPRVWIAGLDSSSQAELRDMAVQRRMAEASCTRLKGLERQSSMPAS
jgi:hypothetical protein